MLLKNSCIASIVAISGLLTMPNIAQAKDIESYQDYRDYCSPAAYQYGIQSSDCDRYKNIYENRLLEETEQSEQRQIRRNARKETSNTNQDNRIKGYVGGSLGAFFPTEYLGFIDLNTGFGASFYGGAKFNKYFATDIEIALLGGGTELSDINYGVFAAFINPRFILPLTDRNNGVSLFLSPGIGISQANIGDSDVKFLDDYRFTWQAKAGVSIPVSKRLSTFGQVRYASQTEENTIDFFGTEIGLNFEF
jgi:opacity protein-like surface antigen